MAVIYYASSVPGVLFLVPLADGRLSRATISAGAKAVVLSTLYGVFDEVHQAFTPERTPDARDLLADALGAALGVAAILLLRAAVTRMLAARK
jgi:VanZ family protein